VDDRISELEMEIEVVPGVWLPVAAS